MKKQVNMTAADGGQAASGDINNIHIHTPSQNGDAQEERPLVRLESELRIEYQQKTGIRDCPKPARDIIEYLLADHAFSLRGLRLAWNNDALSWDKSKAELRVNVPIWRALVGWALIAIATYYFVTYVIFSVPQNVWAALPGVAFGAIITSVCFWASGTGFLWPRHVALQVKALVDQGLLDTSILGEKKSNRQSSDE